MNRIAWIISGILVAAIIVLITLFASPIGASRIEKEIEKANHCTVKEDCINAGSKCPFGCYNYVNKNEVDRIRHLMTSFQSNCVYNCMYCPDVACNNSRCEPVCQ